MAYNKNYRPRIPFSEWFPKLKLMKEGTVFHTIRFIDKYDFYKELEMSGTIVDIYMSNTQQTIAKCKIIGVGVFTIYDLDDKIIRADTYQHWTLAKLWGLLSKFYQRKPDWKNRNTRFIIIFLLPIEVSFETSWEPMFKGQG